MGGRDLTDFSNYIAWVLFWPTDQMHRVSIQCRRVASFPRRRAILCKARSCNNLNDRTKKARKGGRRTSGFVSHFPVPPEEQVQYCMMSPQYRPVTTG